MDKEHTVKNIQLFLNYADPGNELLKTELFPGVDLYYLKFGKNPIHLRHETIDGIIQINYCRKGQLRWKMKSGSSIYLNHGDYSLHTMQACCESLMTFPQGYYEGLTLCLDLDMLEKTPLTLFGSGYRPDFLYGKFCSGNRITSVAADRKSESIFPAFYSLPEKRALDCARLKFWELLILLENLDLTPGRMLKEYTPDNEAVVSSVHEYLLQNMDKHITIEELARLHHINTTTLKAAFKSIYGMSIGAYAKEQRLRRAAKLLLETGMSVGEVAGASGYGSQSKFAGAFRGLYGMLPNEYRKAGGSCKRNGDKGN